MRYYHYLSTSKVEMLFPQIPPDILSGLKVELGFDVGLLKGKLAGEHRDSSTTVRRAEAIEKYLERTSQISSAIKECMWLRTDIRGRSGVLPSCPGLVLFGGRLNNAILLLAGSERHLVSGSSSPGKDFGWSFMPRTLSALKRFLEHNYELLEADPSSVAESYVFGSPDGDIGGSMFRALHSLPDEGLPEPSFSFSFLARVFFSRTNSRGETLALGSPLYVADA